MCDIEFARVARELNDVAQVHLGSSWWAGKDICFSLSALATSCFKGLRMNVGLPSFKSLSKITFNFEKRCRVAQISILPVQVMQPE